MDEKVNPNVPLFAKSIVDLSKKTQQFKVLLLVERPDNAKLIKDAFQLILQDVYNNSNEVFVCTTLYLSRDLEPWVNTTQGISVYDYVVFRPEAPYTTPKKMKAILNRVVDSAEVVRLAIPDSGFIKEYSAEGVTIHFSVPMSDWTEVLLQVRKLISS